MGKTWPLGTCALSDLRPAAAESHTELLQELGDKEETGRNWWAHFLNEGEPKSEEAAPERPRRDGSRLDHLRPPRKEPRSKGRRALSETHP